MALWQLPHPRCAKCEKTVDTMETLYRPQDDTYEITVTCHGDTDTMRMPSEFVIDFMNTRGSVEAVAFQTKQIHATEADLLIMDGVSDGQASNG